MQTLFYINPGFRVRRKQFCNTVPSLTDMQFVVSLQCNGDDGKKSKNQEN